MYNISIRRRATKDLVNLPIGYQKLISQHINELATKLDFRKRSIVTVK